MRTLDAMRRMPRTAAGVTVTLVFALAGCGDDDDFANDERAPAPITLSASITRSNVTISPSRLGAGAIELIASNQTATSQRLTLSSRTLSDGGEPLEQRTGPINPGDTASLTADLVEGTYRLTTRSPTIAAATLRVGPRRPSAKDELLQP